MEYSIEEVGRAILSYASDGTVPDWVSLPTSGAQAATLQSELVTTLEVIRKGYEEYGPGEEGLALSFNGGKDCTVLLALVGAIREEMGVEGGWCGAYLKTRNPFPAVETFIGESAAWAGLDLLEVPPPENGGGMKATLTRLLELRPSIKGMWMGTRKTDPYSDSLEPFAPTDDGWPPLVRINPILPWSYQTVWDFLLAFHVPFCSLYGQGYTSLGDIHNTNPNPLLAVSDGFAPAWQLVDGGSERGGRS